MVKQGVIAFDMDGVLVEVGDSYRETIVQTVAHCFPKPSLSPPIDSSFWSRDSFCPFGDCFSL